MQLARGAAVLTREHFDQLDVVILLTQQGMFDTYIILNFIDSQIAFVVFDAVPGGDLVRLWELLLQGGKVGESEMNLARQALRMGG